MALDVAREMAALTLAIAGKTLFDADVEGEESRIGPGLTTALASFNLALLPFGDRLVRLPIPAARRFRRARAEMDAFIYKMIAERRAAGGAGRDVLSLLIAARDEDGDRRGLTDGHIRDEALTLLLAGHETTANALAWTWHLLALHPEAEAALHREVDAVLGGRPASAADAPRLEYTRAVLAESMRLYPPAYLLGRRAQTEYQPPGTGYVLPAKTAVFVSQHLLHRDPRFWDAPDRFEPHRWLRGEHPATHRFAYFPFGGGPRICIGEHFAWMEGVLVLATLAERWRFVSDRRQRIEPEPIVTLRLRGGLPLTARRRV
jgi:cytochrome P450